MRGRKSGCEQMKRRGESLVTFTISHLEEAFILRDLHPGITIHSALLFRLEGDKRTTV